MMMLMQDPDVIRQGQVDHGEIHRKDQYVDQTQPDMEDDCGDDDDDDDVHDDGNDDDVGHVDDDDVQDVSEDRSQLLCFNVGGKKYYVLR